MVVFAARDPLSKDIYVCLLCLEEICLQSGDKWLPLWQLSHLIIVIAIVIVFVFVFALSCVFVFAFFCVFVFVWVMLTNDSVLWQLPLTPSFFLSHLIFSSIWPHFSLFMALSASQTIVFFIPELHSSHSWPIFTFVHGFTEYKARDSHSWTTVWLLIRGVQISYHKY